MKGDQVAKLAEVVEATPSEGGTNLEQALEHFELAGDSDQTEWSVGQIRGPRKLPVRILETT